MCQPNRVFVVVQVLASMAVAQARAGPPDTDTEACVADHARATSHRQVAIPDNSSRGVTLGPLSTASSGIIAEVILAVSLSHANTADITMSLEYDADRDGRPDASSPVEIYLARRHLCHGTESWACPVELSGTYFFLDSGWWEAGEEASFEVFTGLKACGDWYLSIVDSGPGRVGTVSGWEIYTAMAHEDL